MANLIRFGNTENRDRIADVIFIHGLDGNPISTWSNGDNGVWPEWLASDIPEIRVWSLAYDAASSQWIGHGLPLFDRAENVFPVLEENEIASKPVVFIAHSLGGLLVKQLLRLGATRGKAYGQRLVHMTRAVLFFGTPHTGSVVANLTNLLRVIYRPTNTTLELEKHAPHLRELNDWFRDNFERMGLFAEVYRETQPYKGIMVVDPAASDPGIKDIDVIPIDGNHVTISKFSYNNDVYYERVRRHIRRLVLPSQTSSVSDTLSDAGIQHSDDALRVYIKVAMSSPPNAQAEIQRGLVQIADTTWPVQMFGSTPNTSPEVCLEMVRSAHVCVFVGGGSAATKLDKMSRRPVLAEEIADARASIIPALLYIKKGAARRDSESNGNTESNPWVSAKPFKDVAELKTQVLKDLHSIAQAVSASLKYEQTPSLVNMHSKVIGLLDLGLYTEAMDVNSAILNKHPFSPRAHYNHACAYSRMGQMATTMPKKNQCIATARRRLADAIRFGIMQLIALGKTSHDVRTPAERIIDDPDLRFLFDSVEDAERNVRSENYKGLELHFGGCVCGCM